ncbi:MAG: hypothetical protein GXY83_32315 [Rhodopirellula sp.]|nr:hypothetical protein [Rhodopirellula sp.]
MTQKLVWAIVCVAGLACGSCFGAVETCPWPVEELLKPPRTFSADQYTEKQVPGVKSLLYESLPFRGKPTKVFAYYGAPEGQAPAGGWPTIVIAHGGGGTAYANYVKMWNGRGYAAIAMDLYGKLPAPGVAPVKRQAVEDGYPYPAPAKDRTEEWTYHAVSQIVLAHSLLRSFPELNPDATGLVGTSWGGIHACIAAGLDPRFKFVIAVYGCGFLSSGDDSVAFHRIWRNGLPWWDPSHFLPQIKTPCFWINGTGDLNFSPDMWQKSVSATPGTVASCLVVNLGHSDGGQAYPLNARIADTILRGGPGFPRLSKPVLNGREVSIKVESHKPLVRADLCYATERVQRAKQTWQTMPATLGTGTVTATLPENTIAFFINVYDEAGQPAPTGPAWPTTSEYVELP